MKQIKIYYWSPHINKDVATVKAVLNSAKSLEKYSQKYDVNIINVFGILKSRRKTEWNIFFTALLIYLDKWQ